LKKKSIDSSTPLTYIETTKVFVETPVFTEDATKELLEKELRGVQILLTINPEAGKVVPGCKGLRKLRWGVKGRGKRGGARIIYYWVAKRDQTLLLYLFPKNEIEDLTSKLQDTERICQERVR
jgi:hypothetical protein